MEELFAARPDPGRVRDRDAGARHQHAGQDRGDREAGQVEWRAPRRLTPGEYTQLTGRAGRRGIDVEGHAVVLWQPGLDPLAVAGLAGTRTYPLSSSFRPTYNMAVNLVGQVGRDARGPAARVVVRPVPGRSRRGRAGPPGGQAAGADRRARRQPASAATSSSYDQLRRELGELERDESRQRTAPPGTRRRSRRWRSSGRATSSTCPAAARPASRSCCRAAGPATAARCRWC